MPVASIDQVNSARRAFGAAAQYDTDAIAGAINIIDQEVDLGGSSAPRAAATGTAGGKTCYFTANLRRQP